MSKGHNMLLRIYVNFRDFKEEINSIYSSLTRLKERRNIDKSYNHIRRQLLYKSKKPDSKLGNKENTSY